MKGVFNFTNRNQIADWLNARAMWCAIAEIGCAYGGFARELLSKWSGKKYYMVDLWQKQPEGVYREKTFDVNYNAWFDECVVLSVLDQRVCLLQGLSVEMAKMVQDEELDMVFIDANHSFEAVTADMNAWFPKVKVGGVFCGHDYVDDTNWPNFCQVKSAVDKWMSERGMDFDVCDTSWFSIKEKR